MPLDLFKHEQERIEREQHQAQQALESGQVTFDQVQDLIDKALRLVGNCERTYGLAAPQVRRMFNQVFLKKIAIDEGEVADAELTDTFAQLLAHDMAREQGRTSENSGPSSYRSSSKQLLEALSGLYSNDSQRELFVKLFTLVD